VGLYLCVFRDDLVDEELEGVEVGSYADFHRFRETVAATLEGGTWGDRFATLMGHDDSNGVWTPAEAARLAQELRTISAAFAALPPVEFAADWQRELLRGTGMSPASLRESFVDVDGENLLDRLIDLAEVAVTANRPISFQ
jgi:hypothetical protein